MERHINFDDPAEREKLLRSIRPEDARQHHELLKTIFSKEIEYRTEDRDHEYFENLYWCAFLLFHVGDPADVETMWQAKYINMDTGSGFDTESFFGAGTQETLKYLRENNLGHLAESIGDGFTEQELRDWSEAIERYYYES